MSQTGTVDAPSCRRIALIAHDNKKRDMREWAAYTRHHLAQYGTRDGQVVGLCSRLRFRGGYAGRMLALRWKTLSGRRSF